MKKYRVTCMESRLKGSEVGCLYFKSKKRLENFCIQWTHNKDYFCFVEEYQYANYYNDFSEGYYWICSFQYGKEVASYNNPYWKAKVQLSSLYGRMCY